MPEWRSYEPCCFVSALDVDAAFCSECGRPLFRCAGFSACRNLVNPLGFCRICLHPELYLDKDVNLQAGVGDVTTVAFRLRNESTAARALTVLNIFKREAQGDRQTVPLSWEHIDPGSERRFSVVTEPLQSGGSHRLGLTLVLASKAGEIEEHYAFGTEVVIKVASGAAPTQIVQNFDLSNSDFGTAGMVVANPNLQQRAERSDAASGRQEALGLERAERFELVAGYRGYTDKGWRVPRSTIFEYLGFPSADVPPNGALTGVQPLLRCGRNSRRRDPERNPRPNDLCLRAYDQGTLDVDTSRAVSRHLCDFLLQNDRLYLRAREDARLAANGEAMAEGELRVVNDGDSFSLPAAHPKAFTVTARFTASAGVVERVSLERHPAASGCA